MKIANLIISSMILLLIWQQAFSRSGCCSWHGGVNHCDSSSGRIVCNDGTYSPTCMCEPNSNNPAFSVPVPSSAPQPQTEPEYQPQPQPQTQSQSQSQSYNEDKPALGKAMATCSARNKSTGAIFSATGNGDSQSSAAQDARNNVITNCQQTSNQPDDCIISNCVSSQY